MSDALLSPVVGGAFWAVSAGMIGLSARKIPSESDGSKTVLMGVMGAFVFAAQMINFTIPGTGYMAMSARGFRSALDSHPPIALMPGDLFAIAGAAALFALVRHLF
nr:energy-coupling factor ABC transporter permease [Chlorobaculum tepidum]